MDASLLFRPSTEMGEIVYEEQQEDIGSESHSESPSTSRNSVGSSASSSELADDASSSGSDNFEMCSLMTQLPFKRGLSKFFDGKSQSFTSLAAVACVEDLAKPPSKRLKSSRSCEGGLHAHCCHILSPRRHCPKSAGARKAATRSPRAVLGAAPRRPPLATPARPEDLAGNVLVVT